MLHPIGALVPHPPREMPLPPLPVGALLLLLSVLHLGGAAEVSCANGELLVLENLCNPYLGEIGTAILASDGSNYTTMCRWVRYLFACLLTYLLTHSLTDLRTY